MTKPDNIKDLNWWKTTTMDHLRSFNDLLPLLTEILDLAASAQIPVDLCFDKLKKHILAPLDRIRILAGSVDYPDEKNPANGLKDFDSLIAVGPGGITTVLPAFDAVYRGLDVLRSTRAFTAKAQIVQSEIRQMSGSLLSCVRHLRTHLFRGVFDPKGGFRELAVLLESPAAARILPVGKPKSHMVETIDLIDLKWDSPFSLTTSLASAFGDASDPRKMLSEIVCQGEFGLEYFYSRIVAPFLDEVERTEYQEISNILCKCCLALARKILNKAVRDRSPGEAHASRVHVIRRVGILSRLQSTTPPWMNIFRGGVKLRRTAMKISLTPIPWTEMNGGRRQRKVQTSRHAVAEDIHTIYHRTLMLLPLPESVNTLQNRPPKLGHGLGPSQSGLMLTLPFVQNLKQNLKLHSRKIFVRQLLSQRVNGSNWCRRYCLAFPTRTRTKELVWPIFLQPIRTKPCTVALATSITQIRT
ncbi:hypothetical protein B0H19DRAFT_516404 [Mycena capillaripes]|nr:hypothetical protein B0H19DRAFT_516404 [Mycena capillaripes]